MCDSGEATMGNHPWARSDEFRMCIADICETVPLSLSPAVVAAAIAAAAISTTSHHDNTLPGTHHTFFHSTEHLCDAA